MRELPFISRETVDPRNLKVSTEDTVWSKMLGGDGVRVLLLKSTIVSTVDRVELQVFLMTCLYVDSSLS